MDTLIWILGLFGLWQLIVFVWRWLVSFKFVPPQVSLLFLVKDNQDSVEGLFRQLALDCFFMGRYTAPGRVLVVDLGSQDQTREIIQRLAREFSFLHLRRCEEAQLGNLIQEFHQGVVVLDMRTLSPKRAVNAARHVLQRSLPQEHHQTAGQMDA